MPAAAELMRNGWRVAVVMPAFNEEAQIESAIQSVPSWVDSLVVVDDGSTDMTYQQAKSVLPEFGKIVRTTGLGVGGAISRGYEVVISQLDSDNENTDDWAAVVMAGDGQMDPQDIDNLLTPLTRVPFVKGDRFSHHEGLGEMPKNRRFGSWVLGKLTSLASGREVKDPQCGYTAVTVDALRQWDWVSEWQGYGYPNWWLLNLGAGSIPFESVPVKSVYRDEKSGIKVFKFLPRISLLLLVGLWRRGWNWYVKGEGKTPITSRLAVSSTWFSAILLMSTLPILIFLEPPSFALIPAVLGLLAVTWKLDQTEVHRRLNNL